MNEDQAVVLNLQDVRKDFRSGFKRRSKSVVIGLDLELTAGRLFGFLGPNGAGKTTTLNMILGFLRPTAGSIQVFGLPPTDWRSREKLGFLSETPRGDGFETGRRFLRRMDAFAGRPVEGREARVEEALRQVDLLGAGTAKLSSYSKGMTQRIGFAQALLGDPELLILDEPMSNMDPLQRETVKEILRQRQGRGRTTLFSTHNLDDVQNLCDQLVILHEGRKVAEGTVKELISGSRQTIIEFQVPTEDPVPQEVLSVEQPTIPVGGAPGRWRTQVLDEHKGEALHKLLHFGAEIILVKPADRSLTEVFRQYVQPQEGRS